MEIYFDWELDDKAEQPKDTNNLVYIEIREFAKGRYGVLVEQIDALWVDKTKPPFVVFSLLETGCKVQYFHIPDHLLQKLQSCISEDDFDYITDKIWYKIQDEKKKQRDGN